MLVVLSEKLKESGDGLWRMACAMWRVVRLCWETGFKSFMLECTNASLLTMLQSKGMFEWREMNRE